LMVSFKSTTTDQDNPNKSPWPSWGRKGGRWSNPLPPQNARQFMHHKRGTFERIFCQNSFDAICQSVNLRYVFLKSFRSQERRSLTDRKRSQHYSVRYYTVFTKKQFVYLLYSQFVIATANCTHEREREMCCLSVVKRRWLDGEDRGTLPHLPSAPLHINQCTPVQFH
jgi:hypothetical protein